MPPTTSSFKDFALKPDCLPAIKAAGWTTPTEVQAGGLASALAGRDLVVCAPTGTGKTGLYALTLLTRLAEGKPRPGFPRGLVVVPTRELAVQVAKVVKMLGCTDEVPTLFGGVPYGPQDKSLSMKPDIVVATPGRLLDHVKRKAVTLSELSILVLDEADRLFDAGFMDEMRNVLNLLPEKRQTILLSATMPEEMSKNARSVLRDPVQVRVGIVATREKLREAFYTVAEERKDDLLHALIAENPARQTLVFTRTRRKSARAAKVARMMGREALELHGGLSQFERLKALDAFREGKAPLLIATDVAARGLDIPELALVINYDVPNTPEDYVHRSGRTGRLEREGTALTLVAPKDLGLVAAIEMFLHRSFPLERRATFAPSGDETPAPARGSEFWQEVERAQDMDERPYHVGKPESPFTKGGHLRQKHRLAVEDANRPRRSARRRTDRKFKNAKLPHQRRSGSNPAKAPLGQIRDAKPVRRKRDEG